MVTDTLRKMGLFGIGILALTQEMLEEFTLEMIKKGEEKISNRVKDAIDNSGVATKKDMQVLEKRIENLEKDITAKSTTTID